MVNLNEKYYSGESGEKYSKYIGQDKLSHLGHFLQSKFFLSKLNSKMNVLDFGCGNGALAKIIEPHVKSIEGIEVNDYPRELAKSNNNLIVYSSIEEVKKNLKKYSAIISNHVLEHVPNPIDTLAELKDLLEPNGILVFMLPIDDFRSPGNQSWNPGNLDRHLHTWTPLLIGNTFENAGYMPIKIQVISYAWSERFFFLGDTFLQALVCRILAIFLKSRQLFVVAKKINEQA